MREQSEGGKVFTSSMGESSHLEKLSSSIEWSEGGKKQIVLCKKKKKSLLLVFIYLIALRPYWMKKYS